MASVQHDGQTAGFSAVYIRLPERRLAVVAFSNVYAAPIESVGKFALRHAELGLRTPRPKPIADTVPQTTLRVSQLLSSAMSAASDWREEWFSPDYWRVLKPWLPEIAETHRRFGQVRSVTLVGHDRDDAAAATLTYRAVYPKVRRLLTLRVDSQGRIESRSAVDE